MNVAVAAALACCVVHVGVIGFVARAALLPAFGVVGVVGVVGAAIVALLPRSSPGAVSRAPTSAATEGPWANLRDAATRGRPAPWRPPTDHLEAGSTDKDRQAEPSAGGAWRRWVGRRAATSSTPTSPLSW